MDCPLCSSQTRRIFNKHGYWIRRCLACYHCFAEVLPSADHVSRVYQDEYFKGGMAGYPDYVGEADTLREHGRLYGSLLNQYTSPGTVLDIGSAAGFILKGLQDCGWRGMGLEPNLSMAEYARETLCLSVENGCLEEFSSGEQFDVICMVQVIAHFFDIRNAMLRAASLTRGGGYWLIETWDRESWPARLLGRHWHEYSPPSVLHWFSPSSLSRFASQFGFFEVARGKPVKRISVKHAKSLLEYKLQGSFSARLLGLLRVIPDDKVVRYPAFDLFWILFQKADDH